MTSAEYNQVIAITRKLAKSRGVADKDVGAGYLAAGIAKALGENASAYAPGFAAKEFADALNRIPDASSDELDCLPPLHPDKQLKDLLCGKLKAFREGGLDASQAFKVLVEDPVVKADLARLLGIRPPADRPDVPGLVRRLTRLFHNGYHIGSIRYGRDNPAKASEYVCGSSDKEYLEAVRKFNNQKSDVFLDVYSDTVGSSYFRGLLRQYGLPGADLLLAVLVNELTPYSRSSENGITVRELVWALAPDCYHRLSGRAADEVEKLVKEHAALKYAEHPFVENSPLSASVMPVQDELDAFCRQIQASSEPDYGVHPY